MGTWNNKINGNDTFLDIYQNFFNAYNQGQNPVDVSKQILNDYAEMFNDSDDRNNSLFGLALAQWETKSLDSKIYLQVKEIIESDNDLEVWKGLGADEKTLKQRKVVLNNFLEKISSVKEKPKRRAIQYEFITIELSQIIAFDNENNAELWTMVSANEEIKRKRQEVIHQFIEQLLANKKIKGRPSPKLQFITLVLEKIVAPDNNKEFELSEHYTNNVYSQTGSGLSWATGGGSVFYYTSQCQITKVRWLNAQTLEVRHDKNIVFTKKEETFFYSGDEGNVIYIPE